MLADKPQGSPDEKVGWGSDVAAQMLRRFKFPYVSLNPGASYRGLHDSIVNHLGNEQPSMVLCLHEDHAVAIAHGYAKATGEPMACVLHSNVGLMHGMMAIYNAFVDRAPIVILGATGPVDAALRRPWIDWIHTSADQGGLIRSFVKWDNQPTSPDALVEAMTRANLLARTQPCAPVYICLDAGLQEASLDKEPVWPDLSKFQPPEPARPAKADVERTAALLKGAKRPFLLLGRGSRSPEAWTTRVKLAERLGACVLTDLKTSAVFPTDHPAHLAPPANRISPAARKALGEADVILSLDWIDLGGTLAASRSEPAVAGKVIHASLDHNLHGGAHMIYQALPALDVFMPACGDAVAADLLEALGEGRRDPWRASLPVKERSPRSDGKATLADVARALREALGPDVDKVSLTSHSRGWPGELWPFRDPLAYMGKDGGGGIGSGPGLSVGAALALHTRGRLPVAILGDGDFMMGGSAIWTAVRHRIPLLAIINNNRSYFNDELHQETVARRRNRPAENRWIGQRISDPEIEIPQFAQSQGAVGIGPVKEAARIKEAIDEAVGVLRKGGVCVVDVHVDPDEERSAASTGARKT
jgi:thiamine pyrophosphate-dependent acetolactate synthase large subunit-like protein